MCYLGAATGKSVEEEGTFERIQEWQQPQGLPTRGGQLAPLQLVQQVSFKYCINAHIYSLYTLNPVCHWCEAVIVGYLTNTHNPDLDQGFVGVTLLSCGMKG